jgi:hypothetical protein
MALITMPLTGRFGNLLFQYAYLRSYAEQNGYEVCLPPWIGEKVFTIPHAVRPDKYKPDIELPEDLHQRQSSLIYTRQQAREWFTFKPEILERLEPIRNMIRRIVILNLREGKDYISAGMVCISQASYVKALELNFGVGQIFDWEIDTNPTTIPSFTGDSWASGLGTTEVCIPSFYRLMTAPVLFRANSTFSWWAATLGTGRVFSPVIEGMKGGIPNQNCENFVEGNWPRMSQDEACTDLRLSDE